MAAFFEQQDRARRNTTVLIVLMAAAVLGMGGALYALIVFVGPSVAPWLRQPDAAVTVFDGAGLPSACILGTAAVVAVASGGRMLSLRGGGAQVAESLGGRLVSGCEQNALERRLLNVVEEMAIASGVPVPQVFVMDAEDTINAFAAGFSVDDAAVAVTRGALEKLTREELQGVIAHEFSHVLNGDMRLNLKLMGIVYGIMCVGLLGRFLMRIGMSGGRGRRGGGGLPAALGFGVYAIGLVGELCGKLIKAAVSRQREFLADASAVQFTRNPGGIGGALKKIGGIGSPGSDIRTVYAEEASHFFFGEIRRRLVPGGLLATHPPLEERIQRIDPSFRGEFPRVASGIAEPADDAVSGFAAGGTGAAGEGLTPHAGAGTPLDARSVLAQAGTTSTDAIDEGRRLLAELPSVLRTAANNPLSASAIVYALLLSDEPSFLERQIGVIESSSGPAARMELMRVAGAARALPRRDRTPLVALCAPALRQLSPDQRAAFSRTVQALIDADQHVSVFEYVIGHTLRERLAPTKPAARVHPRALKAVRTEIELVLSLLAHAGASEASAAARAFAAGSSRVTSLRLTLLRPSAHLLHGLGTALAALHALPPRVAAQVVDACAHAALADRRVTDDETTLLRAVCDALGCPLPPVVTSGAG